MQSEYTQDYGGFGNANANTIWFKYKALRTDDDGKKNPYGKLVRWIKGEGEEKGREEAFGFVQGLLHHVQYRLNNGSPSDGVEPYNEVIVTLAAMKNGEEWFYKIPLRASSTGGFGIARRLVNLHHGEFVSIAAGVIDNNPAIWIQKLLAGNKEKIEAAETGITFRSYDGLVGARLDMAKNENAALREEWVEQAVKALPFYTENAPAPATAPQPAAPAAPDDYDVFSDE